MSLVDLRARATEPEQLDEGVPEAEALRSLADLRFVNRWLGNRASLLRAVRPHLPPGGRLLDVGCGSGDVPAFLLKHLPGPLLAVGIDVKTLHLRAAPRAVRRVVADVRRLPFPDGAFDVVTASLFLHHFDEEALPAILAGLHRLARRALVVNDLHRARRPVPLRPRGLPPPVPEPGERRGRAPVDPPGLPRRRAAGRVRAGRAADRHRAPPVPVPPPRRRRPGRGRTP